MQAAYRGTALQTRNLNDRLRVRRACARDTACTATIKFKLKKKVDWGDKMCVVGNHKAFGRWDLERAPELGWNEGDVWTAKIDLPDDVKVEYKLVNVKGMGDPEWEKGDNRKLRLGKDTVTVALKWNETGNGAVSKSTASIDEASVPGDPVYLSDSASDSVDFASSSNGAPSFTVDTPLDRLPQNTWQGKSVEFMRENNHTKDRQGRWNTEGLDGVLRDLVQGDEKSGSWLQKLGLAKDFIVDRSPDMRPTLDTLAPIYIYLQWISTGSIACVEGGGHYRPNRHAELAKIMFRSLEWVAGDASRGDMDKLVARRMQAKLPSFSESFTASVPLTRIRDIAHRNDIPSDLKREIKHTLQNKLHRNAGPEDLVATEAMLERITAPGTDYSGAFVHEFEVFTEELRDFFNAGSLAKNLEGVRGALDDSGVSAVNRFLDAKAQMDGKGMDAGMNDIVDVMHQLTTVRTTLVSGLSSGLRNDAPDDAMVMRQRWRLADLRSEDYAFVLMSRFLNLLEARGGAQALAAQHEKDWALPLGMLVLSLRHCGLSGWLPGEAMALDEEITCWQKLGLALSREDTMRLKASLERGKRLTDAYAQAQLDTFADRAVRLGGALGLPSDVQNVFTEAEIRANVVFQLSKLNTMLLQACRGTLNAADFDGVVLGSAAGKLLRVDSIQPGMQLAGDTPVVLLVKSATGDEEITTAGASIQGVILCQDLPHLSHLGVRSRQERVPLATCTSADVVAKVLEPLVDANVRLTVSSDSTTVKKTTELLTATAERATNGNGNGSLAREATVRVDTATVLPLTEVSSETCGAKAAACGRLATIAAESASASINAGSRGDFLAPPGAVLPFGCMETCVAAAGKTEEFTALVEKLDGAAVGQELDKACATVQALLRETCQPGAELMTQVQKELGSGADVVIARSSANVEDLAGLSGAGLYESIPNLEAGDSRALAAGIAEVWASLFSRRAVLSRRSAGIAQKEACMAVLVQEMLAPELSFVLHTADPLSSSSGKPDPSSVYAELAPGLGETLAAGTEGSAWRMSISKSSGEVTVRAFANFSQAYLPVSEAKAAVNPAASIYGSKGSADEGRVGMVSRRAVDYSKHMLSTNEEKRTALALRLAAVGQKLEDAFGGAQDVEGAVADGRLYVVQSRPQP